MGRFLTSCIAVAFLCGPGAESAVAGAPVATAPSPEATALSPEATAPSPEATAPPAEPWKSFRFHPGPRSQCGTFAVTELTLLRRFGKDEHVVRSAERYYGSFDAGLEHNVADATALGGSLFAGFDGVRSQLGVRARVRRWLSNRASLDLAPGLVLGGKEEKGSDLLGPALILRASLNLSASFGVTAQTFETRRQRPQRVEKERATYVGAQLNSKAGSVGLGLVLVVATVVAVAVVSSADWHW